jgi:hypothetical protein
MNSLLSRTFVQIAGVGLLALSAASCGAGGPGPFLGTYSGTGTTTATLTQPQMAVIPPSMTMNTVTISASSAAGVDMLVNIGDQGSGDCIINFMRTGETASLIAGQSCPGMSNGLTFTVTWTTGTMSLAGTTLNASLNGNLMGSSGGVAVAGTTGITFAGTRR